MQSVMSCPKGNQELMSRPKSALRAAHKLLVVHVHRAVQCIQWCTQYSAVHSVVYTVQCSAFSGVHRAVHMPVNISYHKAHSLKLI